MFGVDDLAIAAVISSLASAGGNIWAGNQSAKGQKAANEANLEIAREQMGFQAFMSDTAWQRGVADMRMAGLNPMLAFTQGPASTPAGSSATMLNERAPLAEGVSRGLSSAVQAASVINNLRQQNADIAATHASIEKTKQDTETSASQAYFNQEAAANAKSQVNLNSARTIQTMTQERGNQFDNLVKGYSIPNKKLDYLVDTGQYGMALKYAERMGLDVNSAANLLHLFKGRSPSPRGYDVDKVHPDTGEVISTTRTRNVY